MKELNEREIDKKDQKGRKLVCVHKLKQLKHFSNKHDKNLKKKESIRVNGGIKAAKNFHYSFISVHSSTYRVTFIKSRDLP